jgi:hypothetical protein
MWYINEWDVHSSRNCNDCVYVCSSILRANWKAVMLSSLLFVGSHSSQDLRICELCVLFTIKLKNILSFSSSKIASFFFHSIEVYWTATAWGED